MPRDCVFAGSATVALPVMPVCPARSTRAFVATPICTDNRRSFAALEAVRVTYRRPSPVGALVTPIAGRGVQTAPVAGVAADVGLGGDVGVRVAVAAITVAVAVRANTRVGVRVSVAAAPVVGVT